MRRLIWLLAAAAFVAPPGRSSAGDAGGTGADASASAGSIAAGVQFGTPPVPGGGDGRRCTWRRPLAADVIGAPYWATMRRGDVTYRLWYRSCPSGTTTVWIADQSPDQLAVLASDSVARTLPRPAPSTAPAPDLGVVNLSMWFWVAAGAWHSVSATAWVPTPGGSAWATVTAVPRRLVLDPGDGVLGEGPVSCAGPGPAWTPSDGDGAASPCAYTYHHSSAVVATGRFSGTVSIEWSVSWVSNVAPGGPLATQTTTTPITVVVADVQAIVR